MNLIEQLLYRHKILNLNIEKLERWNRVESIDKLIFAARIGMFNIRLKCIELLSTRSKQTEVNSLLTSLISDEVEIVYEAAIKVLKPYAPAETLELIDKTRKDRKARKKKKRTNSYIANIQFGDTGKARPSERLMNNLRDQQRINHPPFGL